MQVKLIYARAANGVIGKEGQMPWHLPEDLAHFKRLTGTSPVVMGRKTWESLPARFRPLPGRRNIVITRQKNWHENGAQRASSLGGALELCEQSDTIWVIGGAQIYALALPLASAVEVTEIERSYAGDAYAPELGPEWHEARRERVLAADGTPLSFVRYERAG
jgi:dihydrofolate reductase